MTLANGLKGFNAISIGLLIAVACWIRLSSLEDMPAHLGDEAYYANLAARLIDGRPVSLWTTSGNLADPFFVLLEIPLLLAFKPAVWALRVPAALSGLLAIAGVYVLGKRILDRTTALLAAILLVALPVAIVFSRIGCEFSQTPLFDLFALYFAFRGEGKKTFAASIACLAVHPTNIFLLPVIVSVYLTRVLIDAKDDRALQRRVLVRTAILSGTAVVAVGILTFRRVATQQFYRETYKTHNPLEFALSFGEFFLCQWAPRRPGIPWTSVVRPFDWLYFGAGLVIAVAGVQRLVSRRQWDRLALIGGLLVSVVGLHVVTGTHVLKDPTHRYGAFLIMPGVLALACLLEALLVPPTTRPRATIRQAQLAAIVASIWPFLVIVQWYWFNHFTVGGQESLWTFRLDRPEPSRQLYSGILRDYADSRGDAAAPPAQPRAGSSPAPSLMVVAQDWWTYPQLEYFARPRRDIEVTFAKDAFLTEKASALNQLRASLASGAYVTGHANALGEFALRSLYPVSYLQSLNTVDNRGRRFITAHRIHRAVPVPADYDGDGKADLALFDPTTGHWVIRRSSDGIERSQRGNGTDRNYAAPGDYDGDGACEQVTFLAESGRWGHDAAPPAQAAGKADHILVVIPAPGDYDGDGIADRVTYEPKPVKWRLSLSGGGERVELFGIPRQCLPVPADYDGDGKSDLACFDFGRNRYLVRYSRDGTNHDVAFGGDQELLPVPADYDGDGKADAAVYIAATAEWSIPRPDGTRTSVTFGTPRRGIPIPADYDGDGKADLATFDPRSGAWNVRATKHAQEIVTVWKPTPAPSTRLAAKSAGATDRRRP